MLGTLFFGDCIHIVREKDSHNRLTFPKAKVMTSVLSVGQEPAASTLPVELVVLKILEVHPRFIIRNIYKKFWNSYTIPRVLNYAKNLTLTSLNMQRLSSTGDKTCCISSSIHIMLQ